jgi:hypothetical protein
LQDIIDHGKYIVLTAKLKKAIKFYKMREVYQDSIINASYTVDLSGNKYEEITVERKNKAIMCIYEIIGRLAANIKFDTITSLDKQRAPIANLEHIKLYYKENIIAELNIIASELYGLNSYPKFSYKVTGKIYIATCQITQSPIETTGEGKTKAEAKQTACLNMLLKLQEQDIAYPFKLISQEELTESTKVVSAEKINNIKTDHINIEHTDKSKSEPIKQATNIKQDNKKPQKEENQPNKPLSLNQIAYINPSNSQELLHNMLIKNNITPPSYSIVKYNEEPPFEFEATCDIPQLDLKIVILEGSPRKAKEEAAERLLWEISALNILKE